MPYQQHEPSKERVLDDMVVDFDRIVRLLVEKAKLSIEMEFGSDVLSNIINPRRIGLRGKDQARLMLLGSLILWFGLVPPSRTSLDSSEEDLKASSSMFADNMKRFKPDIIRMFGKVLRDHRDMYSRPDELMADFREKLANDGKIVRGPYLLEILNMVTKS